MVPLSLSIWILIFKIKITSFFHQLNQIKLISKYLSFQTIINHILYMVGMPGINISANVEPGKMNALGTFGVHLINSTGMMQWRPLAEWHNQKSHLVEVSFVNPVHRYSVSVTWSVSQLLVL